MNRTIPLLLVAATLTACATTSVQQRSDSRASLSQVFSTEAAIRYGLGEVCIRAIVGGRSIDTVAAPPRAMVVDPARNGGFPGEQVWFVGSGVYVHADPRGGCTVRTRGGDAQAQSRLTDELLTSAGFALAPQSPAGNARMDRRLHCRPGAAALVSVARAGAGRTAPLQVTVMALASGEEPRCGPTA